ncbi:MAG: DNA polymerase Y family protein [Planctomycetes bacterium]|nr:DNA polymerase Y family protein [Planctomycetota bacterium]
MKRALALYFPCLSTDRWPASDEAVTDNAAARDAAGRSTDPAGGGVRPGSAAARRPAPHRGESSGTSERDDSEASVIRRRLETLAIRAGSLSPTVHIEGDDTLILDVTGCARLFHGEWNLLRQAMEAVARRDVQVRGAIADTLGAAWALAHAHPDAAVIAEPGQTAAYVAPLPVWSLRIDRASVAMLDCMGVETVEALLHLPRSSLAMRFGDDWLDRLDGALGDLPEVPVPFRPRPAVSRGVEFGAPTDRRDVLGEGLCAALRELCGELERRVAGVCHLFVTFNCPDVVTEEGTQTRSAVLEVNLSRPTRSAAHLRSLLFVRLETLRLPAPADALTVWAPNLEPLDDRQEELFETGARQARALADLVDRLTVRLGPAVVVRGEARSEHQPEQAFRYVSLVDASLPATTRPAALGPRRGRKAGETASPLPAVCVCRPLRLAALPLEIAATSVIPDGPPIAFRLHGRQHRIAASIGPERIETGWWRGPHLRRDYYRVTTDDGRHCWLFRQRDGGRWFLHGWFD